MQVKSIAEGSKGSILQYFQPSLSYHLALRSLFCLFLSGRLLYFFFYPFPAIHDNCHLLSGLLMYLIAYIANNEFMDMLCNKKKGS